jgi:hypothetical protein
MSDVNQTQDFLQQAGEKPKLPGSLNVLTILTFIGCGLGFLSSTWNFINAKSGIDKMEEMINSGKVDALPAFMKKMFSAEALEMARKAYENRTPIFLITMVGIVLCLMGAIQMRKLKAQGYALYVIGELIPFIPFIVFLGIGSMTGIQGIIGICITVLFILLYTAQRKHLTK